MLQIIVPERQLWDEKKEEFLTVKETTLLMEHSLMSLSKWESKWKIPFLGKEPHTIEQTIDYIRCMTLTKNVDPNVFYCFTSENIAEITDYINAQMTASHVTHKDKKRNTSGEQVTSELIYYWMDELHINWEAQKWHLSRLLMLIDISNTKNNPEKEKASTKDIMKRNASLNAARRAKYHTRG